MPPFDHSRDQPSRSSWELPQPAPVSESSPSSRGAAVSVAGRTLSILVMMLGIALPAVIIVRDRAQAAKCLNDAKGIALACKLYALDHQGDYPPNLEQLVPKYLPDAKIFECPLRKNQPPVGYNYFGGKDSDPPTKVLLSSKATTRNHKRIIITADAAGVLQRED